MSYASPPSSGSPGTVSAPAAERLVHLAARALRVPRALLVQVREGSCRLRAGAGLQAEQEAAIEATLPESYLESVALGSFPHALHAGSSDSGAAAFLHAFAVRTCLGAAVPVRNGHSAVVMLVGDDLPREWSPEDRETLDGLAVSLAAEWELGWERERRTEAEERLELLSSVSSLVVGAGSFQDQARTLAGRVRRVFRMDACVIRLLQGEELVLLASDGAPEDQLRDRLPVQWGLAGQILESRRPLFIPDVHVNPATAPMAGTLPNPFRFVSYAGAPLLLEDRLLGILGIYSRERILDFSQTDLEQLQGIARQVAVALENERLFQEVREHQARLQAEAAERERQRELLQTVLDQIPVMVRLLDSEGRYRFVNREFERVLGWTLRDAQERDIFAELYPDPVEADRIREAVRSSAYTGGRTRPRVRDGRVIDTEWNCVRLSDGSNIGIGVDVTERLRTERRNLAFQALGERLNAAATPEEAARTMLAVADELMGWDASWLVLFDSGSDAARMVFLVDTLEGQRVEQEPPPVSPNSLAHRVRSEGPLRITRTPAEIESARADVQSVFTPRTLPSASLLCVPVHIGTRSIGALSIQSYRSEAYSEADLRDLAAMADYCAGALERTRVEAERRELQEQLLQSQKMDAVGRLAGGVAHDFNNMLAVINGYCDMILRGLPPDSPIRPRLQEIGRAGERAAELTRQLLAFSRKQILELRVINLNEVVRGSERMLGRLIGEDVELRVRLQSRLGCVRADPVQLEQVLLNLSINARDAMPKGGTLTLQTAEIDLSRVTSRPGGLPPGRYALLTVADTGCGMDRETVARIFEPFFTTKEVGRGTGLGLATVFGIIKQLEGHIEVESEAGHGTRFHLYLPLVAESPPVPELSDPAGIEGGSETVLVAEDEEMVRTLVTRLLRSWGYRVLEAENGVAALRLAEGAPEPIDLLLTDVVMPGGINGPDLAARLSLSRPGLRVLYMSGHADDAIVPHSVLKADAAFLWKPFSSTTLAERVRAVLDAEAPRSRGTVLVVDDDPAARETLAELLLEAGYTVYTGADGRRALDSLCGGLRPDVILLDLVMPGMNGWVFRTEQAKNRLLADIPVVLMSGVQDPAPAAEFLKTEAALPKPVDPSRLLETVARFCREAGAAPRWRGKASGKCRKVIE